MPARTITVRLRRKSRTTTRPRLTLVSVPSQRSMTSQIVPRTVAELLRPLVRKRPARVSAQAPDHAPAEPAARARAPALAGPCAAPEAAALQPHLGESPGRAPCATGAPGRRPSRTGRPGSGPRGASSPWSAARCRCRASMNDADRQLARLRQRRERLWPFWLGVRPPAGPSPHPDPSRGRAPAPCGRRGRAPARGSRRRRSPGSRTGRPRWGRRSPRPRRPVFDRDAGPARILDEPAERVGRARRSTVSRLVMTKIDSPSALLDRRRWASSCRPARSGARGPAARRSSTGPSTRAWPGPPGA